MITAAETVTECVYGESCPLHVENLPFVKKVSFLLAPEPIPIIFDISPLFHMRITPLHRQPGVLRT